MSKVEAVAPSTTKEPEKIVEGQIDADEYIIQLFKKRCPQLINDDEEDEDENMEESGLGVYKHLETILKAENNEEFDREDVFFGNIDFEENAILEYSSDEDEEDDDDDGANDTTQQQQNNNKKNDGKEEEFDVTKLNLLEFCKLSNPALAGEKFVRTAFQDQFKHLFNSEYLSDVVFDIQDGETKKQIYAHKLILQTRSNYFRSMFESNMVEAVCSKENKFEIKVDDMRYDVIYAVLQFLYTGVLEIKYETSLLILAAANKFQLSDVKDIIAQYFSEIIDSDIACSLYEESYYHHAENLRSLCLDFIERNPAEVVKSESFQTMTKDMVIGIIESDYLWISEYTLFEACMKWAKYQAEQDSNQDYTDYMKQIIEYIRFPMMTVSELREKIEKEHHNVVPAEYILEAYKVHAKVPDVPPSIRTRTRRKSSTFTWDDVKKPKTIRVTNKKLTVSTTHKKAMATTINASIEWSTGIHYWTIYIDAAPSTCDIMIGVTNPHRSIGDKFLSHHGHGWGLSCNGGKRCHNSVLTEYADMKIGRGDVVGVLLDLEAKTLEFFVNGNSMGIAYSNVSGPVSPAITLFHPNERATLYPKARPPKY